MIRYKKIIMTLALLLTAVTGAWAEEKMVTINSSTMSSGAVTATGFNTLLDNLYVSSNTATITTSEGVITKLVIKKGDIYGDAFTEANVGVTPGTITYGSDEITVTDINAESVTLSRKGGQNWSPSSVDVYYDAPAEWPLTSQDGKNWILDKMPANNIELQVEYEPTKVTLAANDKTMGTVEVGGESKVEWTADTWSGWNSGQNTEMTKSDGGITMTYTNAANHTYDGRIRENENSHALEFFINENIDDCTVTFSSDEGNISRIELSMTEEYSENSFSVGGTTYTYGNPHILPLDGWTFEGKSAVWEGEATKSLTLQSCSTTVSKITFFKGGVPDGVTVNGDGTFTVAKTATVTLTATPAEGYKFLYWEDDQTNTNPVREVTIEPGEADMTYKAVFAEITYTVEFAEGTEESDKWTASPNADVKKGQTVTVTYTGSKKVLGVKAEKKKAPTLATALENGAVVKIDYTWDGVHTIFTFTNNGGTYSCTVTGNSASNFAASLTKNGNTLTFVATNNPWSDANLNIDFYATDNGFYFNQKGSYYQTFTISVNGTDVTSQLSELK